MVSGCPEATIQGVAVEESEFDATVEAACSEGWDGSLQVHCSLQGTWDEPTQQCGRRGVWA